MHLAPTGINAVSDECFYKIHKLQKLTTKMFLQLCRIGKLMKNLPLVYDIHLSPPDVIFMRHSSVPEETYT